MRWVIFWFAIFTALVSEAAQAKEVRVTLLGTGLPIPSPSQFGPSTLVEAGDKAFLFDCGRGCSTRLTQARPELFNKLDHVFLTHLHSDHVVGIPDLWLNGWTQNRSTNFRIWGPVGTRGLMDGLRQAFAWDINIRANIAKVPGTTTGLDYEVNEVSKTGIVYDDGEVRITAFEVDHGEVKPAFGYTIEYQKHKIVLSGDTRLTPELKRQSKGASLLIQEVVPPAMEDYLRKNYSTEQANKIISHHTTVSEVAELVRDAKPRMLVYSHYPKSQSSDRQLAEATSKIWNGPFALGEDLMTILIGDTIRVCKTAEKCRKINSKRVKGVSQ